MQTMTNIAFAHTAGLSSKRATIYKPQFCRKQAPLQPPLPTKRRRAPTAIIEQLNRLSIDADLTTPVASGSFGEVFFGNLQPGGEAVVLKRANGTRLARTLFRTERAVNRKLDCGRDETPQHWPKYLGEYFYKSNTYLVWRREGDGDTLEDYLSGRPPQALCQALKVPYAARDGLNFGLFRAVVGSLLKALDELHRGGIVHRDIKPGNVLVTGQGGGPRGGWQGLKVIDFGSSCDTSGVLWRRGIDTLDPLYAAPEQRVCLFAPEKFDVFSVGMIGISALMPSFASAGRLRELKTRLGAAGYDLRRYEREFGAEGELRALFDERNEEARVARALLGDMLKKSAASRKGVRACMDDLGVGQ